jgi:UDP-GlcNAc:undecaprenyl-phosphate GlcNAc-1-phosphate transferase
MKQTMTVKDLVPEETPISLAIANNEKSDGLSSRMPALGWTYLLFLLVLLAGLLLPQTRNFFLLSGWRWVYVMLVSFAVSFSLNPLCSWAALKLNILDRPDSRKLHQRATPLLGGSAVFAGFLSALLVNGIFSTELGVILLASILLFAVGVIDDVKELSAGIKLITQIICTVMIVSSGIILRVIPDTFGLVGLVGNAILTVIWIIGITNAMNFFDGMDGLAGGLGALISFFLGVVAFQTNQPVLGWVAVAMMGGCLGFLPFNFRIKGNARIFLGDAGSTVIGFLLACVAVYGDWAEGNPVVALVSPILIFWIFIFDMVHITVERVLTGKVLNFKQWIEYVGRDHLHHRLANALGGKKKSVLFIYLMCLCLGTSAIVLRNARPLDAVLLIIQASIIVILITILERRGRFANGTLGQNQKKI